MNKPGADNRPSSSQTSISVPEPTPTVEGPCAWCGKPAVERIEIEKARFGLAANGVRVMKRRAITALVCREHTRLKPEEE